MSSDIQQNASISGELAENLWGRTDFEKYDYGWARAENWIVDYRGGLFSRPASEFIDIIEWTEGEDVKFVPFQFSPDTANTYLIVFTNDKVRFVQDGAYVLESDVTVTGVAQLGTSGVGDPYTSLLLHMAGADASTTFTDSSASGHTVTPAGTAQIDDAQSKFGGTSGLFDGNSDYLDADGGTDLAFGTGDFTIDTWIRVDDMSSNQMLFDFRGATYTGQLNCYITTIGRIVLREGTTELLAGASGTIVVDTWHHVAVVRYNGVVTLYVDGVSVGTAELSTDFSGVDTNRPRIGANTVGSADYWFGWIDEFHVTKGLARWTAAFTPPTTGWGNDTIQFTAASHGFSDDDLIKLSAFDDATMLPFNTMTAKVWQSDTNTFLLVNLITGKTLDASSLTTDAGVANRIYTVTSPYGEEELAELRATQVADYVRLTHPDYPAKNLIRTAATNWTISNEDIEIPQASPTGLTLSSVSTDDNWNYVYAVTAINEEGEESVPALLGVIDGPTFASSGQTIRFSWTAASGATSYNIYRGRGSPSNTGQGLTIDDQLGFIATRNGTSFTDPGITPDFSRAPPIDYNPFGNGRIRYVTVSGSPTGYEWSDTITWPAGGSNAFGYPVTTLETAGSAIQSFLLYNGGQDYTGTSVTVAGGSGGTFTAVLSDSTGNNPHCCAIFQQRCVYGATDNEPLRIFGSYTGFFSNFSYTNIGADDESYEFDLDSEAVAPIRYLVPVRGGLLAFTQIGIWLLFGSNQEGLTGNNAQAEIQTSVGAALVPPVYVDSYVIYVAHDGQEVRMLAYDDYNKVYGGRNISLLSNHLFDATIQITSMSFAQVPSKVLYAVQDTGRMIALTIDNENNVYGATPLWTKGYYRYVQSLTEDRASRVYVAVERKIGSNRVLYLERLVRRETFEILEESFCLDSGLALGKTAPSGRLIPDSFTGSVTFIVEGGTPFASGDVGKIIRCGSGKATITAFTSSNEVDATWSRDLVETFPGDSSTPMEFASGSWWMDSTTSTVRGLWHLEGESISVLRDGTVQTSVTVTDGAITLGAASSRVIAGIPYTCTALTLPLTVNDLPIEGRRKNISKVNLRIYRSIGLKLGNALTKLKTIANRGQRLWSSDDALRNAMIEEFVQGNWERDAQIYIVQDSPRPAALLNFIRDTDLGDDKDE